MKILKTREEAQNHRPQGSVGFVPTMGFLHEGHLSLIRQAREENDHVIVSIFVNPTQFNDPADYEKYPTDTGRDLSLLEKENVDCVFLPDKDEMYPDETNIQISAGKLADNLCGRGRPGHFEGVLLIVSRLFHLLQPAQAYFGKKDFQQYRIIQAMTRELDFATGIVGCETVREPDGLAMSSRNSRLSEKGRQQAGLINRALSLAKKTFLDGETSAEVLCEIVKDVIESGSLNQVEYVELVESRTLQKTGKAGENPCLIATAAFCESVRLIDNLELTGSDEI